MTTTPALRRARPTARRGRGAVAGCAAVLGMGLVGIQALTGGPAAAQSLAYTGTATDGLIVLQSGLPGERQIADPPATVSATYDDVSGSFSATPSFDTAYTETFDGPFGLQLYVGAKLAPKGPITGTVDAQTGGFTGSGTVTLAVTVFNEKVSGTQDPAVDGALTDPATCRVDVDLDFNAETSSFDPTSGTLHLVDPQFTVPDFPADPGGCSIATDSINEQLPGASNSVELTFVGELAEPTTTTTAADTTTSSTTTVDDTTTTGVDDPTTTGTPTTITLPNETRPNQLGDLGQCSPNYEACVRVRTGAVNCSDVEGNAKNFKVIGTDPYGLDGDNDGIACEAAAATRPSTSAGTLARTGQDSRTYAVLGAVLLLGGTALLRVRRTLTQV